MRHRARQTGNPASTDGYGTPRVSQPKGFKDEVAFVWKVADKLRGHFKPHEYGSVMLPPLVLRPLALEGGSRAGGNRGPVAEPDCRALHRGLRRDRQLIHAPT